MSTITLKVTGMTCQHCVGHVTEELTELDGVTSVDVVLDPQGTSEVRVAASGEVTDADLLAAVDEAGDYRVVEIAR